VRHLDVGRQRVGIDGEAVVLRGDLHLARAQVLHRVVRAAVAELQLEGAPPHGEPQHLVPQADAEHRHVGGHERRTLLDRVRQRRRIAGAVAEEDAVGLDREQVGAGVLAGNTCTSQP
jgi:hypothetical protein